MSVRDLGEHRLKDIENAVSIFQLGEGSFPPRKTISNTNLPRPASSFVGSEHELTEVQAQLDVATLAAAWEEGKALKASEAVELALTS